MAWRPTEYLIEGELDNTASGKVIGWMKFVGMRRKVTFDLQGDFHRDIRGARIHFKGPASLAKTEDKSPMSGFARNQTGRTGDMTTGYPPADYVSGYCYLEWYSDINGRVVIELDQDKVDIIGETLPPEVCDPISRQEQAQNMMEFLQDIASQFKRRSGHRP